MFPEEIYLEILLKLPVKSLLKCKCVCKSWFSLISNPNFVKSHTTLQTNKPNLIMKAVDDSNGNLLIYSIPHDSLPSLLSPDKQFLEYAVEPDYPFKSSCKAVELIACSCGLVCLWLYLGEEISYSSRNFLCLWNPATKEYKKLPKSPLGDVSSYDISMMGLGYDSKTDDYKLVTRYESVVEVYSLRSNSWMSIGDVNYEFCTHSRNVVGVLVNGGDLHWLAQAQDSSLLVLCLDVADHVFKEIQLPNEPLVETKYMCMDSMALGMLEGCLCVLVCISDHRFEVWVMQDYGIHESWTKRHVINLGNDLLQSLVLSFKSGEILSGFCIAEHLVVYDPKDGSVREPNLPSLTRFLREGCYYESLVSLGSGTYVGGEEEKEEEGCYYESLVSLNLWGSFLSHSRLTPQLE